MFDNTLLDSSPSRKPVLGIVHYVISLAVGVAAFFAAKTIWPQLTMAEESTILYAATVVGVIMAIYALMICYVFADSRLLGLNTVLWVVIAVLLNMLGYFLYSYVSAKKSGEWNRFTIPVAYVCEVILVGVMVLVPLIYTETLPKAQLMTLLVAPPPPPPPPPPPAAAPARVVRRVTAEDVMRAPTVIPKTIAVSSSSDAPAMAGRVAAAVAESH